MITAVGRRVARPNLYLFCLPTCTKNSLLTCPPGSGPAQQQKYGPEQQPWHHQSERIADHALQHESCSQPGGGATQQALKIRPTQVSVSKQKLDRGASRHLTSSTAARRMTKTRLLGFVLRAVKPRPLCHDVVDLSQRMRTSTEYPSPSSRLSKSPKRSPWTLNSTSACSDGKPELAGSSILSVES